ncbi:MAG: hypothetical protein JJU40_03475, partial [Rhodobacteraceae bacterium]|nr:hypothetical protein [Paracoccaceae bacterium]
SLEFGVWLRRTWRAHPADFEMTLAYYAGFGTPLITAHWWASEHAPFTRGHVAPDPVYSELLEQAMFSSGETQTTAFRALAARMNETANKIPLCLRSETVAWRDDLVDMTPSQLQSQENVMAGIETFELRG